MWTAYCSSLVGHSPADRDEGVDVVNGRKTPASTASKLLNVLLAADNSMVYSWCVAVAEQLDSSVAVAVNLGTTAASEKVTRIPVKAHLVGVVELPIKVFDTHPFFLPHWRLLTTSFP